VEKAAPQKSTQEKVGRSLSSNPLFKKATREIERVIIGQGRILRILLASLAARGHVLLVGLPGLAKTLMVKSLAQVLGLSSNRIQFTPDLLPTDITGSDILEGGDKKKNFRFLPGPIFSNIILADEINRTPPKTQAALLEAMQERRVTYGGRTYPLPDPFLVLATQNPIEQEGTYPLPEAQLDRFMFSVFISYPAAEDEEEILRLDPEKAGRTVKKVLSRSDLKSIEKAYAKIPVTDYLVKRTLAIIHGTRGKLVSEWVKWGASPRAGQHLIRAARALALLDQEKYPLWQHIREAALVTIPHRIILDTRARMENKTGVDIVTTLLDDLEKKEEKLPARKRRNK